MQEYDDKKSGLKEGPSPRMDIRPIWRARCITPYNPELLPPEAMPLREEVIKIIITSSLIFNDSYRFEYRIIFVAQANCFNVRDVDHEPDNR